MLVGKHWSFFSSVGESAEKKVIKHGKVVMSSIYQVRNNDKGRSKKQSNNEGKKD